MIVDAVRILSLMACPFVSAGCAMSVEDTEQETAQAGTSRSAITNGNPSPDPPYVVLIGITKPSDTTQYVWCSGSVISQHYIVTSAHCAGSTGLHNVIVRAGQKGETYPYTDPGVTTGVVIPPNWSAQVDWTVNVPWDIALVHLGGAGMGTTFPRARIYAGPESPWTARGGKFSVFGYGGGSDAGGFTDCTANNDGSGTKRGGSFAFLGSGVHEGSTWVTAEGYSSLRTTCHGDSGGPWLLERNGDYLLFAINSGGYFVHNRPILATLLPAKMAWMQARATDTLGFPLSCTKVRDQRTATEVDYYDCAEPPPTDLPPNPPVSFY
jgi:hypothetical protein